MAEVRVMSRPRAPGSRSVAGVARRWARSPQRATPGADGCPPRATPRAPLAGNRLDRPGYRPAPARPLSRAPDGIRHARHADHRLDVVNADDVGATGDAQRD